jgi:hypothetical protein
VTDFPKQPSIIPLIFFYTFSVLKSIEFTPSTHLNDEQTGNIPKKPLEILLLDKNRPAKTEQTDIKTSQIDSESKLN